MRRWGPPNGSNAGGSSCSVSFDPASNPYVTHPPTFPADFVPTNAPVFPFSDEPDFQLIEAVEWAPESTNSNAIVDDEDFVYGELAHRPRPDSNDDPCGCSRPTDPTCLACTDLSCVLYACQEECRSNCLAGDRCGNRRIQRKQWKSLQIFDADKKGKGLKVMEDVRKGDFVAEYVGRAVPKNYLSTLFQRYASERKLYIMALDSDVYLDARKAGGIARYINHSCDPNCVVERWKVRGILRAAVIASRDIPAGTELSFDYQWERKRGRAPTKCHCGAPTCRGTLEVPRSMEEAALERKLSTHWKKPIILRASKEIVNRCVRVFSKESHEYFVADVTSYDEKTGKHLLMYRHDLEEVWENLSEEDWMILDEGAEQFIIRKKTLSTNNSSLLGSGPSTLPNSEVPSLLLQGQGGKNFIYVQTPVKDAMVSKHLLERCQRSCRVSITLHQYAKPPLPVDQNDPEDVEKHKALDKSLDGTVWKLAIVGADVAKAYEILDKNVQYFEKQLEGNNGSSEGMPTHAGTVPGGPAMNGAPGTNGVQARPSTEFVLPRTIVEAVKRRLPFLREKCRNVTITFVPSESISKQFAKVVVEGALVSDVEVSKEHVWKQLLNACDECQSPKNAQGVYLDLGILAGELSNADFSRLLENGPSTGPTTTNTGVADLRQTASEDLTRGSPFFMSFEALQKCVVWVQSDFDKGRVDSTNRLVNEASPTAPRKIYFGCDPQNAAKLWPAVQQRAAEMSQGVKFLWLGADRSYQPLMVRNGGELFEFVRHVSGASVSIDSMTRDHLRIDGRAPPNTGAASLLPSNISASERAALAEGIIRLQIELYRDNAIRQQSWMFGRDWSLARSAATQGVSSSEEASVTNTARMSHLSSRSLVLDSRACATACLEISQIITNLGLSRSISAHACVIFYRFVTVLDASQSQLKLREIELACAFIANKAQKMAKWKKLDAVLEAAYKVFYPGTTFDSTKEEVLVWEDRIIATENEILTSLSYDVFWKGFDHVLATAIDVGKLDPKMAKDIQTFSTTVPVLGAGADLWLSYGVDYIYTASAGFLGLDMTKLFSALSLIPLKVSRAAELISQSVQASHFGKILSSHPAFRDGKEGVENRYRDICKICADSMAKFTSTGFPKDNLSEYEMRYQNLKQANRLRREFVGVPQKVVDESILPALAGICTESTCSAWLDCNEQNCKIILEGSWRGLAMASKLLEEVVGKDYKLTAMDIGVNPLINQSSIQAKADPGLMQMQQIDASDGWGNAIQTTQSHYGRRTGGKSCVPGKLKESDLRACGLRWWIPPSYGPSPSGSLCELFHSREDPDILKGLASLAAQFEQGESTSFSTLKTILGDSGISASVSDSFVAVSLQRWPTEKVAKRENAKEKKNDKHNGKARHIWKTGFSAGALQELQLLFRIHGLVNAPQGHPNFILPVGVGLPSDTAGGGRTSPTPTGSSTVDLKRLDEDIFSLTRTSLENEVAAANERRRRHMVTGPHLVFQPTPFVLQRFVSRKKSKESSTDALSITPTIFASWVHDLLSALFHCHSNNILLRSFQSDQIVVDHCGVAKFSSFYRATVMGKDDKKIDILRAARDRKKDSKHSKKRDDDDDILSNIYAPPEMLLGSPRFTPATDIWTIGCLLCHMLLGKPLYSGKDRQSTLLSIYKLVGTPTSDNYKDGVRFPYYEKPAKRYVPGVAKALTHMLRDSNPEQYTGAIDLISKMLQLDPSQRISAKSVLQHEFMKSHIAKAGTPTFQNQFIEDWVALKKRVLRTEQSEEDDVTEREKGIKRKAMMLAASQSLGTGGGDDDLYNMDDLLGDMGGPPSKIPKL
eukprot:Nitzschia sp. Nitz4//scaffold80_size88189//18388//23841//NITZ4_005082-RA/size88189-processed-gene-0.12-mRNA-1//1//CDS//3329558615//8445//frame0